jgi:hypothetical protein
MKTVQKKTKNQTQIKQTHGKAQKPPNKINNKT